MENQRETRRFRLIKNATFIDTQQKIDESLEKWLPIIQLCVFPKAMAIANQRALFLQGCYDYVISRENTEKDAKAFYERQLYFCYAYRLIITYTGTYKPV